jgi:hypothetical protein
MEFQFKETIRMIASFYNAHGEAPETRRNEMALLNWIQDRRQDKTINPELCAPVEQEFLWDPRKENKKNEI